MSRPQRDRSGCPPPNVSVVDLAVQVSKKTLDEEVNQAFHDGAANELNAFLDACHEPLVSIDFRCSDVSSTIDASLSMIMGDDMVRSSHGTTSGVAQHGHGRRHGKVIAWYDEWGYSQRVVDLADTIANQWK
ncbi:glyceraldehyde-3-phosphate dehydrogenase A, chloroplastic [Aegilops tauschii subsp. strangulata]|uniref:Glyceraldehyde-3-phosphate dehydrogenase A, chloroplastic n=1 Tax=Aegilops tauschii TaxID=37682 RepID=M8CU23_AEGTA